MPRRPRQLTFARPWKRKRPVGPHDVKPVYAPVRVHDMAHDLSGTYRFRWRCTRCSDLAIATEKFAFVPTGCHGNEWDEAELEKLRGRLEDATTTDD